MAAGTERTTRRVQRAIVYADLRASVEERRAHTKRQNDEIRAQRHEAYEEFRRVHSGIQEKDLGDGGIWSFGASSDAVQWALDVQSKRREAKDVALRIGVDEGEVEVRPPEGRLVEDQMTPIERASRLRDLAEPGHVLVTDRVFEDSYGPLSVRPDLSWQRHGPVLLKGIGFVSLYEAYNANKWDGPMRPTGGESLRLPEPVPFEGRGDPVHEVASSFLWGPEFTVSLWMKVTNELLESRAHRWLFAYHDDRCDQRSAEGNPKYANGFGLKLDPGDGETALVLWAHGSDPAAPSGCWHVASCPSVLGWHYLAVTRSAAPELALAVDDAQGMAQADLSDGWPQKRTPAPGLRIGGFPPAGEPAHVSQTRLFRFRALPRCMSYEQLMEDREAGREELKRLGESV